MFSLFLCTPTTLCDSKDNNQRKEVDFEILLWIHVAHSFNTVG